MTARTLLVAATLALAACGTSTTAPAAPEDRPGDTAATSATATGGASEPTVEASDDGHAVFLATVEESLAGTDYEGLALADPEGFVATGEVMCDLLTEGATVDAVLSTYLAELDEARGGVQDDDAVLSGAVLGAATGSICPQHAGLLEEG